jgi:WD40 repeat protein
MWDVASGRQLMKFEQSVRSVAFSPDSSKIVTGSSDQTVRVSAAGG